MTAGAIFPGYGASAVWTAVTGPWSGVYPLANITDKIRASKVARASSAGARRISAVLPAPQRFRALALVGHNIPAGAHLVRVVAFSGPGNDPVSNASTIVYDSGSVRAWPVGSEPVEGYRSIRPFLAPSHVTAQSFCIDLPSTGAVTSIGAIEIGGFWEWPGVSYGRENGVAGGDDDIQLIGGGAEPAGDNAARTVSAQVDLMALGITSTTGLDFQKAFDTNVPFVWSEDFADPVKWARKVMLVRNQALQSIVGRLYRHDAYPVRLIEHLR